MAAAAAAGPAPLVAASTTWPATLLLNVTAASHSEPLSVESPLSLSKRTGKLATCSPGLCGPCITSKLISCVFSRITVGYLREKLAYMLLY